MKRLFVAAALLASLGAPAAADFADGLAAYDGGDYATALDEWRALAEAGDAIAQAALAGLHRYGQGVAEDPARAAQWYRRAARQGEAGAQLNLGEMYASGLGLARDLVQAHFWLSLAAMQGRTWAARRRDRIAAEMSAEELAEAENLARHWKARAE
jgi:TPR repeat protein